MNELRNLEHSHSLAVQTELDSIRVTKKELIGAKNCLEIILSVSKEIQENVHDQIASVVSKCLLSVFPDPYEFRIEFVKKRGRTEARLVFVRGELVVEPLAAAGGGIVDVASFALRLACVLVSKPQLSKVIVLDEPFRHVHHDMRPIAAKLLNVLAKETNTQFVLVSHITEIEGGKVVKL